VLPALAILLYLAPWLAAGPRRARPLAAAALLAAAAALLVAGILARDATAGLAVTHVTTAYEGRTIRPKAFLVDERAAPAWQWHALAAGWLAFAGLCAWWLRARAVAVLPYALGWAFAALGLVVGLQRAAAPAPVGNGPLPVLGPFDGFLLAAAYGAAVLLPLTHERFAVALAKLVLVVALPRLALAGLMAFATANDLGTWLDVHRIDFVATPFGDKPYELAPRSADQLRVLVWFPQLFVLPVLTLVSALGIAIAAHMARAHARERRR
jgi:hypothetical protein